VVGAPQKVSPDKLGSKAAFFTMMPMWSFHEKLLLMWLVGLGLE